MENSCQELGFVSFKKKITPNKLNRKVRKKAKPSSVALCCEKLGLKAPVKSAFQSRILSEPNDQNEGPSGVLG